MSETETTVLDEYKITELVKESLQRDHLFSKNGYEVSFIDLEYSKEENEVVGKVSWIKKDKVASIVSESSQIDEVDVAIGNVDSEDFVNVGI